MCDTPHSCVWKSFVWHDSFMCVTGIGYVTNLCVEWVTSHVSMSHVSSINESCLTYQWVMSHVSMSHVSRINESRLTYEWVMSHIWMSYVWPMDWSQCYNECTRWIHKWMRHEPTYNWITNTHPTYKRVTNPHINRSQTHIWVTNPGINKSRAHTWMSHELTYEWVTKQNVSHIYISHEPIYDEVTNLNIRFGHVEFTHEWVTNLRKNESWD